MTEEINKGGLAHKLKVGPNKKISVFWVTGLNI